jgi:hypothetical protein
MANRLPLTANKEKKRIEELPAGDNLNLAQSGIVNAESIESKIFLGDLIGTATTAINLTRAENILDGTIERERLDGTYDIDITGTANKLERAENILDGIIDPERLDGTYDIDITGSAEKVEIKDTNSSGTYYPLFVEETGSRDIFIDANRNFTYKPQSNSLGINETDPQTTLDVGGDVTAISYFGDGVNLVGIVTQIIPSIGINIKSTQPEGKGVVTIDAYKPVGKTIYVSQNGNDNNTGLSENHPKRTVKSAASIALFGDTIKVFPGVYVEENPIVLAKKVSVEGTELRNVVFTPKYPNLDLFHVNNGCHITDASFIGPEMSDGSAIVSFQPLLGVSTDRYFDAARMLRMNLDFIAKEAVEYAKNEFNLGITTATKCEDDLKKIWKCIIHDITRGGNSRSYAAGSAYYDDEWNINPEILSNPNEVAQTIATVDYSVGIGISVINNVLWGSAQNVVTQVRDLSIQPDPATGSNTSINSCANVVSAVRSCVGVVTTVVGFGSTSGIIQRFPGNCGIGFTTVVGITSAIYYDSTDEENLLLQGFVRVKAPGLNVRVGDRVEIRDLKFECNSGGPGPNIQKFPSGIYGYEFYVYKINEDSSFDLFVGISSIPHTYVSGGYIVDRSVGVTTALYSHTTGVTTITAPGAYVRVGDVVRVRDLEFQCNSGAGTTTIYPTGNEGYDFRVISVPSFGNSFSIQVGTSTIPHNYVSGGVVFPSYSIGVGTITQGPYIRNCTNFIPKSIGMRVNGFEAEPGENDDIGVTGSMSVDSFTQYNQGGIGVSITNGAYSQLVSIFTICNDIAIYTAAGGQCDLTNSNSSFGNYGLYSVGVGDNTTKSIYRYTGEVAETVELESTRNDIVTISGLGLNRPYDGQAIYFDELYYRVASINVTNGGSGYSEENPPEAIIASPLGPDGIKAELSPNVVNGQVVSVDVISTGNQYRKSQGPLNITFSGGSGSNATAVAVLEPIYYNIESATEPVAGISTVILTSSLNNTVSVGTTVYFSRLSLQIATTISFEWVGTGTNINTAKPALGGVAIDDNEVFKDDGGQVIYTSTNQAGNFKIGDDVVINQLTGTISGRSYTQSVLTTVTPLIIALG